MYINSHIAATSWQYDELKMKAFICGAPSCCARLFLDYSLENYVSMNYVNDAVCDDAAIHKIYS
jgi:hypothetical protein